MASTTSSVSGRPRKSPLRADTLPHLAAGMMADAEPADTHPLTRQAGETLSAAELRQLAIREFAAWLGEHLNKHGRPFQEHTITNYIDSAKALERQPHMGP